jgi:hypothetical protein
MKYQAKVKKQATTAVQEDSLTIDESLNKYAAPEFAPEKLKKVEKKFTKQVTHH